MYLKWNCIMIRCLFIRGFPLLPLPLSYLTFTQRSVASMNRRSLLWISQLCQIQTFAGMEAEGCAEVEAVGVTFQSHWGWKEMMSPLSRLPWLISFRRWFNIALHFDLRLLQLPWQYGSNSRRKNTLAILFLSFRTNFYVFLCKKKIEAKVLITLSKGTENKHSFSLLMSHRSLMKNILAACSQALHLHFLWQRSVPHDLDLLYAALLILVVWHRCPSRTE